MGLVVKETERVTDLVADGGTILVNIPLQGGTGRREKSKHTGKSGSRSGGTRNRKWKEQETGTEQDNPG